MDTLKPRRAVVRSIKVLRSRFIKGIFCHCHFHGVTYVHPLLVRCVCNYGNEITGKQG